MPRLKNVRWEQFSKAYVSRETFCNGLRSYAKAYNRKLKTKSDIDVCKSGAYELLTKPHIQARVNELMEKEGFNDEAVDLEHLKLLRQDVDFKAKMAAIKEYNTLKRRTSPNQPVNLTQISFEQHIINNTYGTARMGRALREDETELRRVPESLSEDQHESLGAGEIQEESGSGDIREFDSGAEPEEETYTCFSA